MDRDRQTSPSGRPSRRQPLPPELAEIHAIYDSAPVGLCVLDRELRYVRINQRLARINGTSPSEHIGKTVQEIVPDLASRAEELREKILRTGKPVENVEVSGTTPARPGEQRHWIMQWYPLKDHEGEVTGINAVVQETTERKRAEKDRRDERRILETVMEHSPANLAYLDRDFNFVYANKAYVEASGHSWEKLEGRNHFDVFPSDENLAIFQHVRDTGQAADFVDKPFEYADQPERDTTYWNWTLAPVKDDNDEAQGFVFSLLETTETIKARKALEEYHRVLENQLEQRTGELQQNGERLSAAIDASGAGIYEHTVPLGPDIYFSERWAEILGYTPAELPAYDRFLEWFNERVHPADLPRLEEAYTAFVSGKSREYHVEIRVRHRSGQWRHVEGLSHAIACDPDGRVTRVVGVILDITERKRLEAQLLQAQKMEAIGRLTGGIAHDFNNMMQIVTGFAHRSLRELTLDSPMRGNLERIKGAAERAAGLTRQLLAFSRRQVLQPKVLNLNTVVTNAEKWLHRTLGEDVQLSTALNTEEARVKTDPVQLEQVLVNLAVNARDAMPRGGKLTVETATVVLGDRYPHDEHAVPPGKYVMLAVSDTGCGMDEETQSKIFEPFFTTKPGAKGTGLGLSTAYGVVRQSGGVIRVYSEPGRGTTFKIYLPFAREQIDTEEETAATQEDVQDGNETILLVEDDERTREFTSLELQDLGYKVIQARSGEEALRRCRDHDHPIDLLLVDVILPAMDGRKVADIVAAEKPDLATVYMSGYAEEHVVRQGFLIPGTHFLSKPFTPEQLAAKVREALRTTAAAPGKHPPGNGTSARKREVTRILMVDDDTDAAEPIAFILRREGYEVETADDASTALEKATGMNPHAVLVDIKLPDMDGCELAGRLRESFGDRPPTIIGASGYTPESDQAAAFDHFLVKPIKLKRLRELLAAKPEEA